MIHRADDGLARSEDCLRNVYDGATILLGVDAAVRSVHGQLASDE